MRAPFAGVVVAIGLAGALPAGAVELVESEGVSRGASAVWLIEGEENGATLGEYKAVEAFDTSEGLWVLYSAWEYRCEEAEGGLVGCTFEDGLFGIAPFEGTFEHDDPLLHHARLVGNIEVDAWEDGERLADPGTVRLDIDWTARELGEHMVGVYQQECEAGVSRRHAGGAADARMRIDEWSGVRTFGSTDGRITSRGRSSAGVEWSPRFNCQPPPS